jgi:hypothetical protein
VSRRAFLGAAAGLAGAAALAPPSAARAGSLASVASAAPGTPLFGALTPGTAPWQANSDAERLRASGGTETVGYSSGGLPLLAYWVGQGPTTVVVQGAIHGGPEANSSALTFRLRDYFQARSDEIPPGVRLAFMPETNPDGIALDSRFYLSGVDGNRNWETPDWEADAYDGNGVLRRNLGGPTPMSEPETRAMAAWLREFRPALVVQYHSRGAFVVGATEYAEPYSAASGYHRPQPGGIGRVLSYRATGTMGRWLAINGIGGILIELTNYTDPEVDRNLRGLRAALRVVTEQARTAAG